MERRVILAAALSIVILMGWNYLFPPPKRPLSPPPPEQIAQAAPPAASEAPTPWPPVESAPTEAAEPVEASTEERVTFSSDLYEIELTNRGAAVVSWRLLDYTTNGGHPVDLFPAFVERHAGPLSVDLDDTDLAARINSALYRVERERLPREGGAAAGERITFSWADGRGVEVRKSLSFRGGSYLVGLEIEVADRGRRLPARLVLGPGFSASDPAKPSDGTYYYDGYVVWKGAARVERLKKTKVPTEGGRVSGAVQWAGLEDQYFAALILPDDPQTVVAWKTTRLTPAVAPEGQEAKPAEQTMVSVSVPPAGARLFLGPKKFTLLRELGHDLDRVVWFASNGFLYWIAQHIFKGLLWIHDHTVPNYGVAIILATFVLRLLLFPVNQYAMVSMKKTQMQMQKLQPKMNAIKNRYRKQKDAQSRAKMNQEVMDLYRQEGVNPMGGVTGCLPLLAQFPILIGFYNMLTVAVELRGAPFFGWIRDLAQADPWYVIPLLMGGTMFVQQRMSMTAVTDPMQLQQQRMMMIMPFVFTWICINMPSGMVLYWFVNNLLGIGQQWLVNRHTSRLEAAAQKA